MRAEEQKLLRDFEARLRQLMLLHERLKEKQAETCRILEQRDRAYEALEKDYKTLQTDFHNLKSATTISLDGGDVRQTRQRLSKLVREVDKCIAMLSQQ